MTIIKTAVATDPVAPTVTMIPRKWSSKKGVKEIKRRAALLEADMWTGDVTPGGKRKARKATRYLDGRQARYPAASEVSCLFGSIQSMI
jgi:hypothetical protein